MPIPRLPGRALFALSLLVFGALSLWHGDYVSGLLPIATPTGAAVVWAYLTAAVLIGAGLGLLVERTRSLSALILAALFALWLLAVHVPTLIATPRVGYAWVRLFETWALISAAVLLSRRRPPPDTPPVIDGPPDRIARFAEILFGASLPVFAATHFIYPDFVASLVPAWIPFPLFWAWFTGAAHLAAGLAIVSGVCSRLAATLAGLMFGLWFLLLHLPRVLGEHNNRGEWTSTFVALAMCGAAWLVADSIATRQRAR